MKPYLYLMHYIFFNSTNLLHYMAYTYSSLIFYERHYICWLLINFKSQSEMYFTIKVQTADILKYIFDLKENDTLSLTNLTTVQNKMTHFKMTHCTFLNSKIYAKISNIQNISSLAFLHICFITMLMASSLMGFFCLSWLVIKIFADKAFKIKAKRNLFHNKSRDF